MKLLGLFPGQGSQQVGMGQALAESEPLARELFQKADEALGFKLSTLCFEGPAAELTRTEFTQPAILTVSTICYQLLERAHGQPLPMVAAAGHSLGEYSALVAAQALEFQDAVRLVNKRGRYMQEAVPEGRGKMIAVLGKEQSEIEAALSKVDQGIASIANMNSPGQVVIAGDRTAVDQFSAALGSAKIVELPVSAPFHTSLMSPAAARLREDLATIAIHPPRFPIISNFFARPLKHPEEIRSALEQQVCGPVRWVECMQSAYQQFSPTIAIEFGQGSVLAGLLKRIDRSARCLSASGASDIQKLLHQELGNAA